VPTTTGGRFKLRRMDDRNAWLSVCSLQVLKVGFHIGSGSHQPSRHKVGGAVPPRCKSPKGLLNRIDSTGQSVGYLVREQAYIFFNEFFLMSKCAQTLSSFKL
jgi:hypothetical protein